MAAPSTTHSVTVRKLASTISALWAKIKSTFQTLGNLVTSWSSTTSDSKYPSEKLVKESLDAKAPNAVTTEAAIATGDKLLFSDASDSSKTKRKSTGFDTSKTNQVLKASGAFGSVLYADEAWGGKFRNTLSPFDNYAFKSANCFFGAKPSAIRVEYSTDGGTTWIDYGLTSEQKQAIFNQYAGLTVYCGKNTHIQPGYTGSIVGTKDLSNDNIADQRLRITICESSLANEGGTGSTDRWLYCNLRRIGIYCTTNSSGQGGLHCVFEKRTRGNFKSATDSWVTVGDFNIQGDSGWNSLPCDGGDDANGSICLGSYSDSYYSEVRFTVWANKLNASPAASQTGNPGINKIVAYSELLWINGSSNANVANFGAPYTINASSGNTHFPKGLTSGVAIPISSGGTGATTKKAAEYAINGGMAQGSGEPQDSFQFVFSRVGSDQSAMNGVFLYRTAATIWSWIKGKISSVLGLTATAYGGNAATATTATTAAGYTSGGAIDTALQGKQDDIGIEPSTGDASKFLNEKGAWVVPSGVDSAVFTISGTSITNEMYADIIQAVSEDKIVTLLRGATGNTLMYRLTGVDSAGGIFASRSAGNSIYSISISPTAGAHEVTLSSDTLALSDHSHGNITNDGKSTSDPTSTTMFLRADGAWSVPPASYPPTGAAGKPVFFGSTGYPTECTMVGSQRDSILGQLHPDNLSSETNALFFCVLSQGWARGGYLTVGGALAKLTGLTSSATGSSLSPIFWNGTGFATGCTFHSENIANVGTSGNADSGTGTIYVDTILNTSANTYTYSINADRFIQNKPYKICWLKGTSSAQIKLYRPSSGSNINLYSGTTAVATGKLLPLLGGTHGGSFTSTLIRTATNTFYLIWGY